MIITADTPHWAEAAAQSMTGFATSVIRCKCEAAAECTIPDTDAPDHRPGVSVLVFTISEKDMAARLIERIGQCVMTCPTTACFNGLNGGNSVVVGGRLRFFGDGYQMSKQLNGRRLWRIPVMEGEFLVDEAFGVRPAVGGGNLLIMGEDAPTALRAAEAAVTAMREVSGIILPFPQGVVRCGSKIGSKYKGLIASTNDPYCPTPRAIAPETRLGPAVGSVYETVIDGVDVESVTAAMRHGVEAAADAGALKVSAGNYGGGLGQYQIALNDLFGD